MRCKRCNGSIFVRDGHTGNSYCGGCGTLQEYDNYEAQIGGITGPKGTFIRVGYTGTGSVLAYKDKKIFEANNLIDDITFRLKLTDKSNEIKTMIKDITDGEFGQGEWFSILIGACSYAIMRKEAKNVLPMEEIAATIGCDLYQLGSMIKRVVEHLGLELPEFDLVGMFIRTANSSPKLVGFDREKKERITKQGVFLVNCSLKWFLSTGRRPMPLIIAVLAFVTEVNGLKVKIEDLAKDVQVSLTTCKTRYKELLERLVKVAHEVNLPWGKDVTVKNVVKHAGALIGVMEAKSMRKRNEEGDDGLVSGGICLKDIVRDCLNKDTSMYCDDSQKTMSKYFDVGGESEVAVSLSNTSVNNLSKMYREIADRVRGETHETRKLENRDKTVDKTGFEMVLGEDWWQGKSELSEKLLFKEVLEKDVGFDAALPPSYIKGCIAVKRRKEKIKAAKLRIKMIQKPSDFGNGGEVSLESADSRKRRKIGSAIDWEDMVIQTLLLHDVNDEEIEKGHYKTLLDLHVFNSGEM